MILSVSRRTDIPSFYGEWFLNRLNAGFVYVRNPVNFHQVSKIELNPQNIECIVFWTKNPSENFISSLDYIEKLGYKYYFQYTITSYNQQIEKNIPKKQIQIEKFQTISSNKGKEKVIWRYDPIFFNDYYNMEYHKKWFHFIASKLENYTEKCVISFLDFYSKIKVPLNKIGVSEVLENQMIDFALFATEICKKYNIKIETCCESVDLSAFGIEQGQCIDLNLINRICKKQFDIKKDKNQRKNCGCIKSIDIGTYNTCKNGCIYCYANQNTQIDVLYDSQSPILCSKIFSTDKITEKICKINRTEKHINLFK